MRPKPPYISKVIWLSLFSFCILSISSDAYAQNYIDSLSVGSKIEDSISSQLSRIDSIERIFVQSTVNQEVESGVVRKIDSTQSAYTGKLNQSVTRIDSLNNHPILQKVLPKSSDVSANLPIGKLNQSIPSSKDNVLKIPQIDPKVLSLPNLGSKSDHLVNQESMIDSQVPLGKNIDSVSLKSITRKGEELARDNIKELQELDKMENASQSASSKVKNIKWDKSKIKSSKNIANVLSENINSVQKGMDKMKDFKGKYSKVNLMNPNGPVLTKISKKPTKPWQFSLNLSSQFRNGFAIQLAPTVGYKLHEKWIGGIGISYRLQIIDQDSAFTFAPRQEFSHRLFNQFNFYKNFFLHVEHELPYKQQYQKEEGEWYHLDPQKPKGWIGLALQYGVYKKIKGQTQILYNIIKPDMATENRWTVRVNLIF